MPIVHVPQANFVTGPWQTLRRFFRFEGRLAGVSYVARVGFYELTAPEPAPEGREVGPTALEESRD